jgi:hypothetical protein
MAVKLGHNAGLGDRIVRVTSCQRPEMACSRIYPVGRYEDEPMRRPALAVAAIASFGIPPESPFGGQEVPNTGVRNLCSMERSCGHFSGCRSGKSQWAPGSGRVEPLLRH